MLFKILPTLETIVTMAFCECMPLVRRTILHLLNQVVPCDFADKAVATLILDFNPDTRPSISAD